MDHQSEIELIYQFITHPAGFEVGNSSALLIRQLESGEWAVSWENYFNPHDNYMKHEWEELIIFNAWGAAECFVELRHTLFIGLDLEQEAPERTGYYILIDEEITELKKRYGAK